MRIGVAATPFVAIPTLDWLLTTQHELALVITQPDKPAGRGRVVRESAVAQWAAGHKIPVLKPISLMELDGQIDALDLVVTIGYGKILPEEILSRPRLGFLNLHFSLLPAYRGAAPVQHALLNGEEVSGVTVFQLDKGMDTGAIYSQISVAINPRWRSIELLGELSQIGVQAVEQAIADISMDVKPRPQQGISSLAPKISKQDARIDFNLGSKSVVNAVRAFTYEPGAWTIFGEQPFKISSVKLAEIHSLNSAEIAFIDNHVFVGCSGGTSIELLMVTPAGKKEMSGVEWARGVRLQGGESFG